MKFLIIVSVVLGVAFAAVPRVRRDSTPDDFELPSNATVIVGRINHGFDCSGRKFGYYADDQNNCQIFHVCMPYEDSEGAPQLRMWSFLCGVGSVFDQATLTCNYPESALPCNEAKSYYGINDYFHLEEEEFLSGLFGKFRK
ncbi:U-scoloptoxin(01)-Cw1a-like isoform X3 [Hyalella azteca]|uniref:U-scoloptoxin(01)-Cw1a-like isoform X3 n=1 Tax=Hyalella azteca TaxID=294128 RepID=A0A979FNE0_HYAAZ|nr:U-scoloptoxin(01)-Cw1a-like isoform X3 [Hyalella azteca]